MPRVCFSKCIILCCRARSLAPALLLGCIILWAAPVRADAGPADTLAVYTFDLPPELARQTIYSALADRRGIVYFGTEGGLLEFDSIEWRFIPVQPGVRITHLALNSRGRVFAAGAGVLGYLLVDETGGTVYQPASSGPSSDVPAPEHPRALIPYGPDMLVADEQALYFYRSEQSVLERRQPPASLQLEAAAFFDDRLFLHDRRRGLLQANIPALFAARPDSEEAFFGFFRSVPGTRGLRIRQLQPLNAETLLMASISQGLLQLRSTGEADNYSVSVWENEAESFFRRYPVAASARFANLVAFGSHGGGIMLLNDDGSINQQIGRRQGLREDFIFSLLFTARGRLWAGMNGGAASVLAPGIAESSARETAEARQRMQDTAPAANADTTTAVSDTDEPAGPGFFRRSWNGFTTWVADILPGYGVVTPLDFSDHDPDDFTTILRSVRETKNDSLIFRGAFARELYGVQELAQADSVRHIFPAEVNAFRFSYATNQFEDAGEIQHQVLLEGLDKSWSNWSTNTYREYTNLRFGAYQFRVRSMNPEGEISVESAFRFQIRPPWHQAGWFYALQLILILGMLAISFYLNKTGRAFTVSQFLIYLVIIITFEYVLVYSQPVFYSFTKGIAFFEIALSVILVICLTPVEEGYRWLLNKLTGFTAEELVARRKAREAEAAASKKAGFIEQISSKGRLKR